MKFKIEKRLMEAQHKEILLKSQLEIQEQTLQNISAEIHDNIIQLLSLSKLKMNSILHSTDNATMETAAETKEILSKAIHDLRSLSHHLNGEYIMNKGLQQSILSTLHSIGNHISLKTGFTMIGEEYNLGGNREIVLFRIFQEALNNSLKHSKASEFTVELIYNPEEFKMQLFDNGTGFNTSNSTNGIGLKNIKNRAALINAKFELISQPTQGTLISLTIKKNDGKPGSN